MVDSVEGTHTCNIVRNSAGEREHEVEAANPMGCGDETGMQFADFQPCCFCGKHFVLADVHLREQRHHKEDDTHTANPVHKASPEKYAMGKGVYLAEGCSTSCGKSRYSLKERCRQPRFCAT